MSALGQPWQVLSTCPHCLVEAAVVQVMDPSHPVTHLGRPSEQACRLCGWATRARDEPFHPKRPPGEGRCPNCQAHLSKAAREGNGICGNCSFTPRIRETRAPVRIRDPQIATEALKRWAEAEGDTSVESFCESNLGADLESIVAKLVARQPIETNFDVIAWLFPGGGGGSAANSAGAVQTTPKTRDTDSIRRSPGPRKKAKRVSDPRVPARVLISVMAADGELRPGERQFIDRYLASQGLPNLDTDDLRIWRPHELTAPPNPDEVRMLMEACVHLVHLDRERDGTEWKVVRAFANAWGVSDEDLDRWDREYDHRYSTVMTRLWRTLSGLVRLR
ncbi:MAG: hypothetical protein AB8H79_01865 [Myxococcota bacterium]